MAIDKKNYLFQVWENVTNIRFNPASNISCKIDIEILFAEKDHNDTLRFKKYLEADGTTLVAKHSETDSLSFDGPGGNLAHAFYPQFGGDVHFDDEEIWTIDARTGRKITDIYIYTYIHVCIYIYMYVYMCVYIEYIH